MGYLVPAEYAEFGLATETAEAWVVAASAMVDAFCRRPTLLAQSYTERLRVGRRSGAVRLSYGPVVSVTSVRARFARGDVAGSVFGAEVAGAFCSPGSWVDVSVASLDVDAVLGEVRLPVNVLGGAYGEAEVTYSAGFASVPTPVKVACAQIVKNAQATPGLNVRSSRVDTLQMEYFSGSLLDEQVKALLQPFRAERRS